MKLTPSLKQELDNMTPEYQNKLAHLINVMNDWGSYGEHSADLAVVAPNSNDIIMRDSEA
jgi:hypothetical protein